MTTMAERLLATLNSHDARAIAGLFRDDYISAQPAHPTRGFGGQAQVLANWTAVFAGVPDFAAELLSVTVDGDTEWSEWSWHGRYENGSPFAMRGVTILVLRDAMIGEARLYMEPVDAGDEDIDTAVRRLYRRSSDGAP